VRSAAELAQLANWPSGLGSWGTRRC